VHDDGTRGAIMHNKFVVLNGKTVWTGSWNMSHGDLAYWNHAFVVRSPELSAHYKTQFEYLFSHFAPAHAKGNHVIDLDFVMPTQHSVPVAGRPLEVFFPRNDKATTRVAEVVASAKHSLHFMAFQFTDGPIADAVVDRAAHGVEVKGVFENNGACAGAYPKILAAHGNIELSRWTFGRIQGLRNFLHHKVFIVDHETVVLGSFNFSKSADEANDENLIVITDAELAKAFEQEYDLVAKATKLAAAPAACKPHPAGNAPIATN
jgi:phosphatidylserine/phosphatidylglycerophosphate/cardiolipin synthase-like enzyme